MRAAAPVAAARAHAYVMLQVRIVVALRSRRAGDPRAIRRDRRDLRHRAGWGQGGGPMRGPEIDGGGRRLPGAAVMPRGHPAVVEGTHEPLPPLRDLGGTGRPVWPTDR